MISSLQGEHQLEIDNCLKKCLPDFYHVNHFWDHDREQVVAKILPGEFYMTSDHIAVATTLGSCISACIWDDKIGIGGMNHFMLPTTIKGPDDVNWGQRGMPSDATRYGNYAMEHLVNFILKNGGCKSNLKAKIFGGGKVVQHMSNVGERNIRFVIDYLTTENIVIESADIGDSYPRKVIFEPYSGRAFVKRLDNLANETIVNRENDYYNELDNKNIDGDVELF